MYNALPGRVNIELYLALPPQRHGSKVTRSRPCTRSEARLRRR